MILDRMKLLSPFLLLLLQPTSSLYFLIGVGEPKCFVEEMPANSHAVASYINADWSSAAEDTIAIVVKDIDDAIVHQQSAGITGRFAFTSSDSGLYQICVSVKSSNKGLSKKKKSIDNSLKNSRDGVSSILYFSKNSLLKKQQKEQKEKMENRGEASHKYKFHLEVQVGEGSRNYADLMKKSHMTEIEVDVVRLTDQMRDVTSELKYQNTREEEFRNTSESTNSRVMWWSFIQMAFMIISAAFQSYHLKSFFEAKKLR